MIPRTLVLREGGQEASGVLKVPERWEDRVKFRLAAIFTLVALIMATLAVAVPAQAQSKPVPRYHDLRCDIQPHSLRILLQPRRIRATADTTCYKSGSNIAEIVIWTFVQVYDYDTQRWTTIALSKTRKMNSSSGMTWRTTATAECGGRAVNLFRKKVNVWVFDSYGDLRLADKWAGGNDLYECGPAGGF
jgi:hypothetical protein